MDVHWSQTGEKGQLSFHSLFLVYSTNVTLLIVRTFSVRRCRVVTTWQKVFVSLHNKMFLRSVYMVRKEKKNLISMSLRHSDYKPKEL